MAPGGGQRCPTCQTTADQRHRELRATAAAHRPTTAQRGYGAAYQHNQAIIVARAIAAARAGQPQPCWLCHKPCLEGQKLTAEHKVPRRQGGGHDLANLAPAHTACNTAWNRKR